MWMASFFVKYPYLFSLLVFLRKLPIRYNLSIAFCISSILYHRILRTCKQTLVKLQCYFLTWRQNDKQERLAPSLNNNFACGLDATYSWPTELTLRTYLYWMILTTMYLLLLPVIYYLHLLFSSTIITTKNLVHFLYVGIVYHFLPWLKISHYRPLFAVLQRTFGAWLFFQIS